MATLPFGGMVASFGASRKIFLYSQPSPLERSSPNIVIPASEAILECINRIGDSQDFQIGDAKEKKKKMWSSHPSLEKALFFTRLYVSGNGSTHKRSRGRKQAAARHLRALSAKRTVRTGSVQAEHEEAAQVL